MFAIFEQFMFNLGNELLYLAYGGWIYNYMFVQSVPITIKVVSSNPVHGVV